MERKEKAIELFKQQFNCSQAVFTAYRQTDALDEEKALKLSSVFGAGVACTGRELCGAVTGALLALSLRYGRGDLQSVKDETKAHDLGKRFMTEFEARMGSCSCKTILGMNIGIAENMAKARQLKLFETRCLDAVKAAADILEEML